ncbi:MAG: hypothetical protein LBG43_04095 [Treponema sp.]|nr:hypothetical protein [Treponema sp.]
MFEVALCAYIINIKFNDPFKTFLRIIVEITAPDKRSLSPTTPHHY